MIPASPKLSAILMLARAGKIPLASAEVIVNAAVNDFGLADAQLDQFASLLIGKASAGNGPV